MLVLIADSDQAFADFVQETLEGSEFLTEEVSGNPARIATAGSIVLVGGSYTDLELSGAGAGDRYVIAAVDHEDQIERVLALGADDAICKPVSPRALLSRLRVARHHLIAAPRVTRTASRILEDALRERRTGTVVVRGSLFSGAIHVDQGGISWVEISGRPVSLGSLLARVGVALDPDTSAAVLGEARQTGDHFTRVLSDWGIVTAELGRESLRGYVADEVALLLSEQPAAALFMAYSASRASQLRFAPHEILPESVITSDLAPAVTSSIRALQPIPEPVLTAMNATAALTGCTGATLVSRSTGSRLASSGEALERSFGCSLVHTMGPQRQALTIEDDAVVHLARALDAQRVLIATFSLRAVTLGLARTSMTACCNRALEAVVVSPLELALGVG